MWDWLEFSFRVYLAYLTAQLVIWLALVVGFFLIAGVAALVSLLLEM